MHKGRGLIRDPSIAVRLMLREGCAEVTPNLRAELSLLEGCYEHGNKVCCEQSALAFWAVLNGLISEEEAALYLNWRAFEEYVERALMEIGMNVVKHLRIYVNGKLAEYDVVGYDGKDVVVVECKRWNKMGWKEVLKIAEQHRRKVEGGKYYLRKFGKVAVPMVVVLRSKVPKEAPSLIVPIKYLNEVLSNLDVLKYEIGVPL